MISGAGFINAPEFHGEVLFQMEEGRRRALIVGGIILLGVGAGLTVYIVTRKPKSEILSVNVVKRGEKVYGQANVKNVGHKRGYFKLWGYIYDPTVCPPGTNGYNLDAQLRQVGTCLAGKNTQTEFYGSVFTGSRWEPIDPGQSKTLEGETWQTASGYPWKSGTYAIFVCAAVSTKGSTETRIMANEHYVYQSGFRL